MPIFEPEKTIDLTFARYEIDTDSRTVRTVFPDGISCYGTRDVTTENIREARSQGYKGTDADVVWRSLVEHELLHSLVAECLFSRPSLVLRTEGGGEFHPSWLRYEEEMLVISWQAYVNNSSPLSRYRSLVCGPLARYDLKLLPSRWEQVSMELWKGNDTP